MNWKASNFMWTKEYNRTYQRLWARTNRKVQQAYRRNNPEMTAWVNMHMRCQNLNDLSYPRYGGRGIKVKYRDFAEFIGDVGRRSSSEYSIDRINNDGHYQKGNCRWATRSQQAKNRRERTRNLNGTYI